jgi:hypothetical protein
MKIVSRELWPIDRAHILKRDIVRGSNSSDNRKTITIRCTYKYIFLICRPEGSGVVTEKYSWVQLSYDLSLLQDCNRWTFWRYSWKNNDCVEFISKQTYILDILWSPVPQLTIVVVTITITIYMSFCDQDACKQTQQFDLKKRTHSRDRDREIEIEIDR